jgi:enterochelin esterase-like enzyme
MNVQKAVSSICHSILLSLMATVAISEVRFENAVGSENFARPVNYALYLPPGYETDNRSYPVLYLLHGGGSGQPSDWFTLAGLDQLLDRLIAEGAIRPFIAVAPDGRRNEANDVATYFLNDHNGVLNWETMFFEDFIPAVEKRHRALGTGDARAVLGISMGGVAATLYNLKKPYDFAGSAALSVAFRTKDQVLALSPEAYESRYAGVLGPSLSGEDRLNSSWQAISPSVLVSTVDKSNFGRIPRFYFNTGADDPFFQGAAELHMTLREAGIKHRFLVSEGSHDWNFWRQSLEEAIFHINAVFTRGYGE